MQHYQDSLKVNLSHFRPSFPSVPVIIYEDAVVTVCAEITCAIFKLPVFAELPWHRGSLYYSSCVPSFSGRFLQSGLKCVLVPILLI